MSELPKVSQQLSDPISENLQKLATLFPAAVKDGELDIEALREELGDFAEIQPGDEKYELNWAGKQAAKKEAFKPLLGRTLKYVAEDSKDPETTENIYIEGDNLEALKLLRQNYYGAIKMIYIDPPYNTGKDFVYKDNFKSSAEESDEAEGSRSATGERLSKNEKSSNRFHANWLDMLYPRLKTAKDLLTDNGVMFISIDDNEEQNLRSILDEIFGENNRLDRGSIIWKSACSPRGFNHVVKDHEFILAYAKDIESVSYEYLSIAREEQFDGQLWIARTDANPVAQITFPAGIRCEGPDRTESGIIGSGRTRIEIIGELEVKNNVLAKPVTLEGSWPSKNQLIQYLLDEDDVHDTKGQKWLDVYFTASNFPFVTKQRGRQTMRSIIDDCGNTGSPDVKNLGVPADFPKPVKLLKKLLNNYSSRNGLIMDFYSGSATTAHATMELNAEDGGNRKHIMVQLPESCDEKSEAAKAGYKTIAEIGKERIRRAGEKIKAELVEKHQALLNEDGELELDDKALETNPYILNPDALDIGFKAFRIEDTQINWLKKDLSGGELVDADISSKDQLDFVRGFTDLDVVYEIMLRQSSIPLTQPISTLTEIGNRTYLYGESYLICLEEDITKERVEQLAQLEPTPLKFIFRDSAFGKDIAFKDETFRRLNAEIAKHTDGAESYTVEFI